MVSIGTTPQKTIGKELIYPAAVSCQGGNANDLLAVLCERLGRLIDYLDRERPDGSWGTVADAARILGRHPRKLQEMCREAYAHQCVDGNVTFHVLDSIPCQLETGPTTGGTRYRFRVWLPRCRPATA